MTFTKSRAFPQLKHPKVDQDFHAGRNGGHVVSQRSLSWFPTFSFCFQRLSKVPRVFHNICSKYGRKSKWIFQQRLDFPRFILSCFDQPTDLQVWVKEVYDWQGPGSRRYAYSLHGNWLTQSYLALDLGRNVHQTQIRVCPRNRIHGKKKYWCTLS